MIQNMHYLDSLTDKVNYELMITMIDESGIQKVGIYKKFHVSADTTLDVGDFISTPDMGNIGAALKDDLSSWDGNKFSTMDNDEDGNPDINCAQNRSSPGW